MTLPAFAAAAALLAGGGPADPAPAVDALVAEALRAWHAPGAAVAVVRDGRVVLARGYGVRQLGRDAPVTADTVFPIASCTKAFTACAVARLADAGRLGWDDRARDRLPGFRLADPLASADCRLRDLLCHRTGLASHDLLWYRAPWPAADAVRRAGLLPASRPFRAAFQYQSVMVMAAGLAVEKTAGRPWAEEVRAGLLAPLGMTNTWATSTEAARRPDAAAGHKLAGAAVEAAPPYPQPEPNAAGSLHSSARDLGKWVAFQLGDGTARGTRVLSAAALAETHAPHVALRLDPGTLERRLNPETVQMAYALGWLTQDYRGRRQVSHAGAIDGFRAHVVLWPDDRCGAAVLVNLGRTRMNLALANALGDLLLGLEPRDWNAHFGAVAAAEDAARDAVRRRDDAARGRPVERPGSLAGAYAHPAYGEMRLTEEAGGLAWSWASFRGRLWPLGGRRYVIDDAELPEPEVEFAAGDTPASLEAFGVTFRRVGE